MSQPTTPKPVPVPEYIPDRGGFTRIPRSQKSRMAGFADRIDTLRLWKARYNGKAEVDFISSPAKTRSTKD